MDDDRFSRLNSRQRHYLRLVLIRQNSAEIARAEEARGVTVSKAAVDKIIKQAMEKIGTNSRFAAARALADFEAREGVQRLDLPPEDLATPASPAPNLLPSAALEEATDGDGWLSFEDVGVQYRPSLAKDPLDLPSLRSETSGVGGLAWGRVWRALLITLGLVLATIALGNVYAELSH